MCLGKSEARNLCFVHCEEKYRVMILVVKKGVCVRRALQEWGAELNQPVPVFPDNQSTIAWATREQCPSTRAKHIDIHLHFIRELVKLRDIIMRYIKSKDNDAEILTKAVTVGRLHGALQGIKLQ